MNIDNVSRRGFLGSVFSAGALVLAVRVLPDSALAETSVEGLKADAAPLHPNVYLGINPDGTVYIVCHRSEMGAGIRTSLPMVLADELEADWKRVRVEQAPGDAKYGEQSTDGSHSIRDFFDPMRQAGASARLMLVMAAAARWGVPESECAARLHEVRHEASGRKAGYGELAEAAGRLPVPNKSELKFKAPGEWRYIGKEISGYDIPAMVAGTAQFGMDVRVEGMLYASVERPPVLGGKWTAVDDAGALAVSGVRRTATIPPFKPPHAFQALGGVAVIADNTWAALQGRKKLKIRWEDGPNGSYDSKQYKSELQATARKPGKVVRNIGDVDKEFARGGTIVEAEYYVPHLAHASMEPVVAVAHYHDGKVTAWASTQDPQASQETVAAALGIDKKNVTCYVTLLGGGFGRKSKPDYVAEAAILSRQAGKPVKVVWTREDDIHFDYLHAVAAMYMKARLGRDGKPSAWLQRSVFPPIVSTFEQNAQYGGADEMGMGWTDVPFDLPNHRAENGPAPAHVRIGWMRSVSNIYHAFAVSSFADELAHQAGRDPLDYLLALIGDSRRIDLKAQGVDYSNYGGSAEEYPLDTARLKNVIELAAAKAGWGKRKPGHGWGMGIAAHRSFLTYVASVVEVEVDSNGKLRIPSVHYAVDAGLVVNPERVRSQFEGAAVFGTSVALLGEITASKGRIDQSNFHNYPVARINQAPRKTEVHVVNSTAAPAGIGEPGVPPFPPALCNAIFAATGKRVRELPLSKLGYA